jgi:hypothetical protein
MGAPYWAIGNLASQKRLLPDGGSLVRTAPQSYQAQKDRAECNDLALFSTDDWTIPQSLQMRADEECCLQQRCANSHCDRAGRALPGMALAFSPQLPQDRSRSRREAQMVATWPRCLSGFGLQRAETLRFLGHNPRLGYRQRQRSEPCVCRECGARTTGVSGADPEHAFKSGRTS